MEFTGTQIIKASRAEVWKRLNDPATFQQCLPGCEQYQQGTDGGYDAVIVASVGPIKARFKGTARFSHHEEATGYHIEGSGSGGVAGFGKLGATVRLEDVEGGTSLQYVAAAQMGGKLAQVGSRLVGSVANKFLAEFFLRFEKLVSQEADAGSVLEPSPE
ncbi:carbon monoxide dehydrogenase subunit G (plasmid) [Cupriavidus sp. KK10]|jgi:carbon monoxide dehydrogenase subunit G|uniref:SRPBCC family protein n=1 Tax=Cupriavidus sp. KK10 TaxID=1478019 RepID=UPI001BA4CB1A|nr:carbon monoxide dehydrogenase subunit G [Cupriavidus sp. KK10]QUN32513.1 carbon monoxide dehydrogenase subunit G [Cupriavidus sp. KK10]